MCTQGSTLKHDGSQVVVFTKQEYRQLHGPISHAALTASGSAPVDEGEAQEAEEAAGRAGSWASKQKAKRQKTGRGGGGGGGKAARRPQRGGRGQQQQQRTLDDIVSRLAGR